MALHTTTFRSGKILCYPIILWLKKNSFTYALREARSWKPSISLDSKGV